MPFSRELTDEEWYRARAAGLSTVLRNIDQKTVQAMNGAGGSTHTPANIVVIDGAGMTCAAPWSFAGAHTTASLKHITLGSGVSDDYIRLGAAHAGKTRTLCQPAMPNSSSGHLYSYLATVTPSVSAFRYPGVRTLIPIQPHDRSTLATLKMRFAVTYIGHAHLPVLPKFRVIRVDKSGNVEALHTARSGNYMDDGFLDIVGAPNVAAYENAGAYQWSDTYTPNQNNVVDVSTYGYYVDFVEESGPDAFPTDMVGTTTGNSTNIMRIVMVCNAISLLAPQ